ncbi:a-type inclusion protein [Anaeramoeba flamelloides]|uniref:A-type inclusion protein n=1 Tax=Anaeramoeba flamelloides TaxID=1746091 RepID=A0AAV7ZFV8_9EUKA|nr:a-type inclusion protein [Anaeramoeba flamelloides]
MNYVMEEEEKNKKKKIYFLRGAGHLNMKLFRGYKLESPDSNYSVNKDKSPHRGPIGYTPQNSGIGIHYKYPENYYTEGERLSQQAYKKREMSKRNPQRNNRSRTYREENSKENQLGKKTHMSYRNAVKYNPKKDLENKKKEKNTQKRDIFSKMLSLKTKIKTIEEISQTIKDIKKEQEESLKIIQEKIKKLKEEKKKIKKDSQKELKRLLKDKIKLKLEVEMGITLDQSDTEESNLNSKSGKFDITDPLCGGSSNPRGGISATPKPDLGDSTLTNELNSEVQRMDSELSVIKGKKSLDQKEREKEKEKK